MKFTLKAGSGARPGGKPDSWLPAAGFYGVGCPHPAIECLTTQLNKLIMHYGSQPGLGLNMQTSLELLIIDTGLSLQPVTEDYDTCQHWVTSPWLKSVWEKASCFNIEIQLAPLPLQPPREQDTWIMAEFLQMGYYTHTLRQLNWARLYHQGKWESD